MLRHILATILGGAPGLVEDADAPEMHWCAAELLRVRALGLLKEGKTSAAQHQLKEALNISRRQGAFAWELRAATTLAESYLAEGLSQAAQDLIAPIVERATEGFETSDYRRAVDFIAKLDAAIPA